MKEKKLNFFNVAVMYVGTIMGAGFASGREGWQFFGIFGNKAYVGIALAGFLFMALGMMVSYIARSLKTDDMGKVIVFSDNPKLADAVGYFMAAILYTIIISMSAAGGSLLHQQFGINKAVGGAMIVVLVILTVLGNFDRVSKVFKLIIPVLFVIDIGCCFLVMLSDIEQSGATSGFPPSAMAPNWFIAAVLFISYNMLGMIPIIATSSMQSKDQRNAVFGSGLGGILLAFLTLVLVFALQKDMAYTQSMDLPMLAYTSRISKAANLLFGLVLFAAIYSAATSTYFGFSTKIKESPKKKYIIIIGACIGFVCGLTGFKAIVAYLYPVEGYIGFVIITMITINFFRVHKLNSREKKVNQQGEVFHDFDNYDRFAFPQGIIRVTAGSGGEALLVFGSEKTVLYDCGMAYCHEQLIENISKALTEQGRDRLDIVLLSHTHYDHIGALPYVIEKWPDVSVCAAAKAKSVFESKGAKATMKRLGEAARDEFSTFKDPISVNNLRVDRIVKDGDQIAIGQEYFAVLETPGHTSCSMTYVLEPAGIMFTSESTGVLRDSESVETSALKSHQDTIDSANKCKAYHAKQIVCPHFGVLPEGFVDTYFDLYLKSAEEEKEFILNYARQGYSNEEILEEYEKQFWTAERSKSQPKAAFEENARPIIRHLVDTYGPDNGNAMIAE